MLSAVFELRAGLNVHAAHRLAVDLVIRLIGGAVDGPRRRHTATTHGDGTGRRRDGGARSGAVRRPRRRGGEHRQREPRGHDCENGAPMSRGVGSLRLRSFQLADGVHRDHA